MPQQIDRRGDDRIDPDVLAERSAELDRRAARLATTSGLTGSSVPTPTVARIDPLTGNASAITFDRPTAPGSGTSGLLGPTSLVERARRLLQGVAPVLGLEPTQAPEFVPDPTLMTTTTGATAVTAAQQYLGIPLFQASNTVVFDRDDQPVSVAGRTVSVLEDASTDVVPTLTASRAASLAAAAATTGPGPDGSEPELDPYGQPRRPEPFAAPDYVPGVLAVFDDPDRTTLLEPGPFAGPVVASLVWFPLTHRELRLAWEVLLALPEHRDEYRVIVDADDGAVLYLVDLVRPVLARASIHQVDGAGPLVERPMPVPLATYDIPARPGLRPDFPSDWVSDDLTVGDAAVAHLGGTDQAPRGIPDATGAVVFTPTTPLESATINAFFLVSQLHDYFYLLGFDERFRNFQAVNPPDTGGEDGDPVDVAVFDRPIDKTASMSFAPPDGGGPTLSLGTVELADGDRTSAADLSVVAHEYTHGVTHRLVGSGAGSTLEAPMSLGLDEGWGDFVGCVTTGQTVVGSWLVGSTAGIRKFRYDESFPVATDNYGSVGTGRYVEAHAIGELWCAVLMALAREIGGAVTLQLVVDALKLTPANPGFVEARDALLEAVRLAADVPASEAGALRPPPDALRRAWQVFASFRLGAGAAGAARRLDTVVADATVPDLPEAGPSGPAQDPHGDVAVYAAEPRVAIPDGPAPGVESAVIVPVDVVVDEVRVQVTITHPVPDDLVVRLVDPAGTEVVLADHPDRDGPDLVITLDTASTPALAALRGAAGRGVWRLRVDDTEHKDTGTLVRWSLALPPGPSRLAPSDAPPSLTATLDVALPPGVPVTAFDDALRQWFRTYAAETAGSVDVAVVPDVRIDVSTEAAQARTVAAGRPAGSTLEGFVGAFRGWYEGWVHDPAHDPARDRTTPARRAAVRDTAARVAAAGDPPWELRVLRYDPETGNPAHLRIRGAAGAAVGPVLRRARDQAARLAPVLGLGLDDDLVPCGGPDGAVSFGQQRLGLAVLGGTVTVHLPADGAPGDVVGRVVSDATSPSDLLPRRGALQVVCDVACVFGRSRDVRLVAVLDDRPRRRAVLTAGSVTVTAELVWFPAPSGLRLAWRLTSRARSGPTVVVVDATSGATLSTTDPDGLG